MTSTIQDRIDGLFRELLDTHVELMALLLAEAGVPVDEQREKLNGLVRVLRARTLEPTLFEGGRRVPVLFDENTHTLKLNTELLARVDDGEILFAISKPIATYLDLSPLSVAITLQTREERHLKNLSTKAARRLDTPMVRPTDVPAYVEIKLELFADRLQVLASTLGTSQVFDVKPDESLRSALSSSVSWPDWIDVSDATPLSNAVATMAVALQGTRFADNSETLVELLWESLGLSPVSFLRSAGRTLRGQNFPRTVAVLDAFARGIAVRDSAFSAYLEDWSVYAEIFDAWQMLIRVEKNLFGVADCVPERIPVSVIIPARAAFGLNEPESLPWTEPLVCWTVREQNALRDLFNGLVQTLPSAHHDSVNIKSLHRVDEDMLVTSNDRVDMGVQLVALGSEMVPVDPAHTSRAWSTTLHTMLSQFDQLPENHQLEAVRMLRKAYDDYFPDFSIVWARRFFLVDKMGPFDAFYKLCTEIAQVLASPVLFDVFVKPNVDELAPFPTMTIPIAVPAASEKVPFWVPLSAISSTSKGAPVRLRIISTPADVNEACSWRCDRTLHLNKLEGQPIDLVVHAIHGDSLQFAAITT